MLSKKFTVKSEQGLHVRPAGVLVKSIKDFKSNIKIKYKDKIIEAKSLLGIIGACIKYEDVIEFEVEGIDEEKAMETIEEIMKSKLGE